MRKFLKRIFLSTAALVLVFSASAAVYASGVSVTIDGVAVNFEGQPPTIIDGRTLVPVRGVFETLGFNVGWEPATQTVTLTRADFEVIISIGVDTFTTNGEEFPLDVPAQIIEERTLLPIRAVVESVGYEVSWDGNNSVVIIETVDQTGPEAAPEPGADTSRFIIPNRRLTQAELDAWIAEYHRLGGPNDFELEVLRLVNIERERAGVSPLAANETLMMAARFKTQSMGDIGYMGHESPVFGQFHNMARELFGIEIWAENLGFGQSTPQAVVNSWLNSPQHRANMLNPGHTEVGIGFVNDTEVGMGFNNNIWAKKFK